MVAEAIASNWIAPVGPDLVAFEHELAERSNRRFAIGLASGTAALHLALRELGVGPGDDVIVSTFTFAASANAVAYLGARPVFIDSDATTWNLSVELVADELASRLKGGTRPTAAVIVDIYGQCADYDSLLPLFAEHNIPVVEDAAEALGATYQSRPAGSFGQAATFSFNGNKIITTSGGGMLVCDDQNLSERVRYISTQARQRAPHYQHVEVGFNYRLSNLLAAFGRGQLTYLDSRLERRRLLNQRYRESLSGIEGLEFMPEAPYGRSSCWLTCITVDPRRAPCTREDLRLHLEAHEIESRPTWKPMHLQPVFAAAQSRTDGTSERLFDQGLCLPSGSSLTDAEQERVISVLLARLKN